MAGLHNLRRYRKTLERSRRQVAAAEARLRFGRTLEERAADEAEATRAERTHSGHLLSSVVNLPPKDNGGA